VWPFTKKQRCKHTWSKWTDPKEYIITSPSDNFASEFIPSDTYSITMQFRHCEVCNEQEEKQL